MELNKMPIASGKRNLSMKVATSAVEPGLLPWVGLDIGDDCGRRGMSSSVHWEPLKTTVNIEKPTGSLLPGGWGYLNSGWVRASSQVTLQRCLLPPRSFCSSVLLPARSFGLLYSPELSSATFPAPAPSIPIYMCIFVTTHKHYIVVHTDTHACNTDTHT